MIDIDTLTDAELIDLKHRIVARLRFMREMRTYSACIADIIARPAAR